MARRHVATARRDRTLVMWLKQRAVCAVWAASRILHLQRAGRAVWAHLETRRASQRVTTAAPAASRLRAAGACAIAHATQASRELTGCVLSAPPANTRTPRGQLRVLVALKTQLHHQGAQQCLPASAMLGILGWRAWSASPAHSRT
jgi:hypothetical protein